MSTSHALRPEAEIVVDALMFADDGSIPNNPLLPALLYHGALDGLAGSAQAISLLTANGWGGLWVWRVFDFHHYHPNAHEALACTGGSARLMLGGPKGMDVEIRRGDAVVLPAGTGHKLLSMSPGFEIVGAYPPGQEDYDTNRETAAERADAIERIAAVPLPKTDPYYGANGPLTRHWTGR